MAASTPLNFDIEALKRAALDRYKIKLDDNDPAFSLVAINSLILEQMRDQIVGEAVKKIEDTVTKLVTVTIKVKEDDFRRVLADAETRYVERLNQYLEGQEDNLRAIFDSEIGKFRRTFQGNATAALAPSATPAPPPASTGIVDVFGGAWNMAAALGIVALVVIGACVVGTHI